MIRKLTIVLLLLTVVALMGVPGALATPTIKNNFTTLYGVGGTRIDSCDTCHIPGQTPSFSTLNPYGKDLFNDSAYATNVTQSMINVEPKDSDNDGFTNIVEIHNLTFPGNASDFPPKITSFAPPSPVTSTGTPATVMFNVTLNQVVDNATWALDGTVTKTEHNVNASNDTLTTNTVGTHTVTFTAQRTGDGSAMQNWTWNVSAPITLKSITISPSTANLTVNGTQMFTATALDQNNTPMPGVNINWTSSNMTVGNVSPSSATTNMNGTATTTFTALAPGTAMVNATSGNVSGTATVTVVTVPTFNISGFKINDTNGNGVWDSGEMGIPNWKIMLLNDTGVQLANTSTNASGFYQFMNIFPGKYNIAEEMKAGFTPTNATSMPVTVENMDIINVNFTNQPPTAATFNISGFKINDTNGNGVWDSGEMGIENWNINLLNATGTLIDRTSTNATGFYEFMDLAPGTYNVTEETKAGFTPTNATFRVITIENMDVMNVNFTNKPVIPQTFNISGFKINGATGSGIPGWNVTITNATMQKSMLTSADGSYKFTGLANGTYNVSEEMKAGFTPVSATFHLETIENMDIMNVNFTNMPVTANGSISGTKFNDSDGNGIRESNEAGLANWTIVLKDSTGATVATATTDANGNYSFTNLSAGNYTVGEVLQSGWNQTAPKPVPPGTYTVTLAAGQNVTGKDFGNMLVVRPGLGSISGNVINVATGKGLPNVTIRLVGIVGMGVNTKTIRMETMTDFMGRWMFDNLPAGRYIIIEQLPKGFIPVSPPVMNIMLAQGQNSMNNNFTVNPISALIPSVLLPPPARTS